MPGGLTLLASTPASIPNPPAGKITIFFNTTANAPYYKDSAGNLFPLVGAQGATGSFIVGFDGIDGEDGVSNIPGIQGSPGATGSAGPQGPAGPAIVLTEDIIYPDDLFVPSLATGSGGSPWSLISQSSPTGVSNVDFTGLAGFTDIRVTVKGITFGSSLKAQLRVSIDNGGTFLSSSGDYLGIQGNGTEQSQTELSFYDAAATAARSGEILLSGINLTQPKSARSTFFNTDAIGLALIPTANAVNAVRVFAGGNFTGGTIYVFGRK